MTQVPLRWLHFRDGPEGAGVYVHVADLFALLDSHGAECTRAELEALLDSRAGATLPAIRSHEPPRNSGEGAAVNGPTPLVGGDERHTSS